MVMSGRSQWEPGGPVGVDNPRAEASRWGGG